MALATKTDVATALMRELTAEEDPYVEAMLQFINSAIMLQSPGAMRAAETNEYAYNVIVRVEAECVARVLRAPGGGLYQSETEGDYTYAVNAAVASGLLEVSPREWSLLRSITGGGYGRADQVMGGYAANKVGMWKDGQILSTYKHVGPPDAACGDWLGSYVVDEDEL